MANGRSCRFPSICTRHLTFGRRDAAGSRQSGQLVALSSRCSLLSCFSDDLAAAARAFFNTAFDGDWTAPDLERRLLVDCRHNRGRDAISVASCWNQRMAALLSLKPGLRHHDRQRRDSVHAPKLHRSYQGVPCRPQHSLSRQRGIGSRRLQRRSGEDRDKIWLAGIDGDLLANALRAYLDFHPEFPETGVVNHPLLRLTRFLDF